MLALKLTLVPMFLFLISWASVRFGPAIGGWLAGLPVVGGPILFLVAMENGPEFTAQAAVLALAGVSGAALFALAYAWIATRCTWMEALLSGFGAWLIFVAVVVAVPLNAIGVLAVVVCTLMVSPSLFPARGALPGSLPLSRLELALRMIAGALLTLATTAAAAQLGPKLTGVMAVFPILTAVLAVFSQRTHGSPFVVTLLYHMVGGLYSFAVFCVSLMVLLEPLGTGGGFAIATLAAVLVHHLVRQFKLQRARRPVTAR